MTTDLPNLDTPAAITAELRWVVAEAQALTACDDEARRQRYLARKQALREAIEAQR